MSDNKKRYITVGMEPEMYESVLTEANYRGVTPMAGVMFIVSDWLDMQAENTGRTISKRAAMRLMVMAEKRKREENEGFLNEARHMAALIERNDPDSEELARKFQDLCEFLGVSPEEVAKGAAENDYMKPAVLRSQINEAAMLEILTEAPEVSKKEINRKWKERGLAASAIPRTKESINSGNQFNIVAVEHSDGWYWTLKTRSSEGADVVQ